MNTNSLFHLIPPGLKKALLFIKAGIKTHSLRLSSFFP